MFVGDLMKNFELLGLGAAFLVVLITSSASATPALSCNDSDGGFNYGLPGEVSGYWNSNPISFFMWGDMCNNGVSLHEAYCNGTTPAYTDVYCANVGYPYGCVTNQNGGYCQNIAPSVRPSPTTSSCIDTDGVNYAVRGYVEGYRNGVYFYYKDTCITRSTLREYKCVGNAYASVNVNCQSAGYSYCLQTGHPADSGACYTPPAPAPTQSTDQTLLLVAGVLIVVFAIAWFARGKFGKSAKHGRKK